MPCFKPLEAFLSLSEKTKNGKCVVAFKRVDAGCLSIPISLPCGRCIGCRIDKSRDWAVRCYHEASMYNCNCFITLTYDDDHLPLNDSLVSTELSQFMKSLRRSLRGADIVPQSKNPYPIRYFGCGEYGEKLSRPHYHICIFNYNFPDKYYYTTINKKKYYRSDILEKLWPKGFSLISDFSFKTAAYVARYVTKKINGPKAKAHYAVIDNDTGEIYGYKTPEYTRASRMPGIGKRWIQKYFQEVYTKDYVTVEGQIYSTPSYYDKAYEEINPADYQRIKRQRIEGSADYALDNTKRRLVDRRKVAERKYSLLVREFENDYSNVYHL